MRSYIFLLTFAATIVVFSASAHADYPNRDNATPSSCTFAGCSAANYGVNDSSIGATLDKNDADTVTLYPLTVSGQGINGARFDFTWVGQSNLDGNWVFSFRDADDVEVCTSSVAQTDTAGTFTYSVQVTSLSELCEMWYKNNSFLFSGNAKVVITNDDGGQGKTGDVLYAALNTTSYNFRQAYSYTECSETHIAPPDDYQCDTANLLQYATSVGANIPKGGEIVLSSNGSTNTSSEDVNQTIMMMRVVGADAALDGSTVVRIEDDSTGSVLGTCSWSIPQNGATEQFVVSNLSCGQTYTEMQDANFTLLNNDNAAGSNETVYFLNFWIDYDVLTSAGAVPETYDQWVNETLSLLDGNEDAYAFDRRLTEQVSLSDSHGTGLSLTRSFSETVSLSDAVGSNYLFNVFVSDLLSLADSLSTEKGAVREVSVLLGLSDAADDEKSVSFSPTDMLSLTDASSRLSVLERSFSEALTLADASSLNKVYERSVSEVLSAAESVSEAFRYDRRASETLSLTDSAGRVISIDRSFAETLALRESPETQKLFEEVVTEVLSLADSVSESVTEAGGDVYVRTAEEVLALSEQSSRTIVIDVSVVEGLSLSDDAESARLLEVAVTQIISLIESVTTEESAFVPGTAASNDNELFFCIETPTGREICVNSAGDALIKQGSIFILNR